jgi:hypothetical protein
MAPCLKKTQRRLRMLNSIQTYVYIIYIYNIDIYLFMDQVEVGHVFVQQSTAPPLPRGGVSAR